MTKRIDGVFYARTDDDLELPVIDVTHPAFAMSVADSEISERTRQFVQESRAREGMPPADRARIMAGLQSSRLGRALSQAQGAFVDGISLYMMKLGPDGLWPDANAVDRAIAASFPAWTTRLRLHDIAHLLADGLAPLLARDRHRPLVLIDVAGGPAADALNALLVLRQMHIDLAGRRIHIHVLDGDAAGPSFGARARAALSAPDGPLQGLDSGFTPHHYDWNVPGPLVSLLDEAQRHGAACSVSSEGGLFEYGSDLAIADNLKAVHLHAPDDAIVVGSVTREDGEAVEARGEYRVAIVPRSLEQFRSLAAAAGCAIDAVIERPFSRHVRMLAGGGRAIRPA